MVREKIGILVGAYPLGCEKEYLKEILLSKDTVSVAADGGLSFFVKEKITPSFWIGDRDSVQSSAFEEAKILFPKLDLSPCPREKDDTDMRLGMVTLKNLGIGKVLIFGGLGGERLDHTIANIQLLHEFEKEGIRSILVSEKEYLLVLTAGEELVWPKDKEGILSVFSLEEETKISIRDLKYEYEGSLSNKKVLGISNEFNGRGGRISVRKGTALIVRNAYFKTDEEIFP